MPATGPRHARQVRVPGVGEEGQKRLGQARILIVGMGGLGCPAALYLTGAGVGRIDVMDPDRVELSNLHRQPLYATSDVGRLKVEAAVERLRRQDAAIQVEGIARAFRPGDSVAGYGVVLSCTDDVEAQHALNDACVRAGVPLVHAAVAAWEGELLVVTPGGPCLRCLRPTPTQAPSCADEGVLGPVPGVLGTLQALEALKLLVGLPPPSGLWLWDGRTRETQGVVLKRRDDCTAHVKPVGEAGPACPLPWNAPVVTDITVHELAPRLGEFFLLDVREPDEHEEFALPDSTLIPLGQLPRRLVELPKDRSIAVYCAVGGRSARATDFLRAQGFAAVNVRGGVRAWRLMQGAAA